MTHEDFKNILSMYQIYTKEQVNEFLDGMYQDETLLQLFEQWKTGDKRPMYTTLDFMQENIYKSRAFLRENPKSMLGITRPKDADTPRKKENKNVEQL